eukprot:m.237135 g.237135  ORF g.237135 m.237135 type:complete len:56 (-) comp19363_c0_seq3:223-390(-)
MMHFTSDATCTTLHVGTLLYNDERAYRIPRNVLQSHATPPALYTSHVCLTETWVP